MTGWQKRTVDICPQENVGKRGPSTFASTVTGGLWSGQSPRGGEPGPSPLQVASMNLMMPLSFCNRLQPSLIESMADLIRDLQAQGVTFLVVEHNMPFVLGLCDPVTVLARGSKLAEGPPGGDPHGPGGARRLAWRAGTGPPVMASARSSRISAC